MLIRCFTFIFLLTTLGLSAQIYNLGQNPASTKWSQIKTDEFQLIFPDDFQEKAQELANLLVYANENSRLTLNTGLRRRPSSLKTSNSLSV